MEDLKTLFVEEDSGIKVALRNLSEEEKNDKNIDAQVMLHISAEGFHQDFPIKADNYNNIIRDLAKDIEEWKWQYHQLHQLIQTHKILERQWDDEDTISNDKAIQMFCQKIQDWITDHINHQK